MAQVKVYYDQVGNTLTVWFGNPKDEAVSEETGDERLAALLLNTRCRDRSARVVPRRAIRNS